MSYRLLTYCLLASAPLAVGCGDGMTEDTDSSNSESATSTETAGETTSNSDSEGNSETTGPTGGNSDSDSTTVGPTTDPTTTTTTSEPTTDPTDPTTTTTTTEPTTDPTDPTDPSTTDPSTTDPTDPTDSSTTDPGPYCGDGNVDEGEECDDGDPIDDNSCSNTCELVPCDQQGGMQDEVLSYIWIANSGQGTVSKIETDTAIEVGRYYVEGAQPSRTSVNLFGDVAVSSRHPGGVTKIAAEEVNCVDANNNGMIETSTGPNDILALGADECVVWRKPIASGGYGLGPRATAWVAGKQDPITCEYPDPVLWVAWLDGGTARFLKIDGNDGTTIDETTYPWSGYSPYGGAVDADGNFYVTGLNQAPTVKINFETMELTDLGNPAGCKYGMTLDTNGDIWSGACFGEGVYHWNHENNQWTILPDSGGTRVNGIMADADGNVWGAGSNGCRLVHLDVETKTYVNNNIPLPGCSQPWGVSIDYQGYVWVVDKANIAFKVDPDTYEVVSTVTGLVSPYTYSDMTGVALKQQTVPQ